MDIAALSMDMSSIRLENEIGTAMLAKSLDNMEVLSDGMVRMMEKSVMPYLGQNIDIMA